MLTIIRQQRRIGAQQILERQLPSESSVRNRGAREIKSKPPSIGNDFYDAGIEQIFDRIDRLRSSAYLNLLVFDERLDRGVERGRFNKRLISLNVDDELRVKLSRDFRDSIGARREIG